DPAAPELKRGSALFTGGDDGRVDVFGRARVAGFRAIPDTAAEGSDVEHASVQGIGHDAVSPLEVVAGHARPRAAAIQAAPDGRFKAAGEQVRRVGGVRGDVVDVGVAIQCPAPRSAGVAREVDAPAGVAIDALAAPCREVDATPAGAST